MHLEDYVSIRRHETVTFRSLILSYLLAIYSKERPSEMSSVQLVISQCIGKTTFNCDIQD